MPILHYCDEQNPRHPKLQYNAHPKMEKHAQYSYWFNDMYSRDISKKIRGALTAQKKRGQFMSGFAPYGYVKDPADKHHFLVDEEAAKDGKTRSI